MLYFFALLLLGCGGHMGQRILSGPIIDQPLRPMPLLVTTTVAELAWVIWFIRGFWITWWIPLVGLLCGAMLTGLIIGTSRIWYGGKAPLISMAASFAGLGVMFGAL